HRADHVPGGEFRHPLLQCKAALQRPRLVRGPGADLAAARATGEVGVGFLRRRLFHRSFEPHLAAQRLPVEQQSALGMADQLLALGALMVGVKAEARPVEPLEHPHAQRGRAVRPHRRQAHGRRIVGLALFGLGVPFAEQFERIGLLANHEPQYEGVESLPPPPSCPCDQASVERGMTAAAQLMAGKKGLVMGVANERSIAWAISKACHDAGAKLAFTFQGEALEKRVRPLAKSIGCEKMVYPCDVTDAASIDATFAAVGKEWGEIDFLVHAIAFSNKDQLKGKYLDTTADNFALTMNVSCYSFTAVAQRAVPLMKNGGSLLTLTYYGAERVIPHYNVMGVAKAALEASVRYLAADLGEQKIRVNAISAGPIKTLAFSGIGDARYILKWNELNSPLKRNVEPKEVGNAGLYLLSDLGTGVTGEVIHVDAGYHVVGMVKTSSAKQIAELLAGFEGE